MYALAFQASASATSSVSNCQCVYVYIYIGVTCATSAHTPILTRPHFCLSSYLSHVDGSPFPLAGLGRSRFFIGNTFYSIWKGIRRSCAIDQRI